jgi:hypothetical protein
MSKTLLLGASAIALGIGIAAASPASAQVVVPDASLEGPIQSIDPTPGTGTLPSGPVDYSGTMQVMGITVRVLNNAIVRTDTAAVTVAQLAAAPPLAGRSQDGFVGGTAIVTGDSFGGIIYASNVFAEAAENVILGESTGILDGDITVNGVRAIASTDPRLTAGKPINGFGFEVIPASIPVNSLLSLIGYYANLPGNNNFYYHTLEADVGTLVNPNVPEVNVLRAQCRIRGGNRDELEVRGGTHTPANAAVTIQISDPSVTTGTTPGWRNLTPTAAPVVDATVTPPQGLYRFNRTNLNLPGAVCPAFVRASITVNTVRTFSDPLAPDAR